MKNNVRRARPLHACMRPATCSRNKHVRIRTLSASQPQQPTQPRWYGISYRWQRSKINHQTTQTASKRPLRIFLPLNVLK